MPLLEYDDWKQTADIDEDFLDCLRESLWTYLNQMTPDHDESIRKQLDQMPLEELRSAAAGYGLDIAELEGELMWMNYEAYVDNYDPEGEAGDYWYAYYRDGELSREGQ